MAMGPKPRPEAERFWEKVDRDGPEVILYPQLGRCWLWTVSVNEHGYGKFRVGSMSDGTRRKEYAHRWVWTQANGPIPDGEELDHLCHSLSDCTAGDNCLHRRCVNLIHLQLVTAKVNSLRGNSPLAANARKTHCSNGHPFDDRNTHAKVGGGRICKACNGWANTVGMSSE